MLTAPEDFPSALCQKIEFHTATPKKIKVVRNSEIQKSDPQLRK